MTSSTGLGSSSFRKMVTAYFDSRSDAEDAIERLIDAGVSRDSIRFMPGDERDPPDDPAAASRFRAASKRYSWRSSSARSSA